MVPRMSLGPLPLDDKGADDHNLSLRVNKLACLWLTKGAGP